MTGVKEMLNNRQRSRVEWQELVDEYDKSIGVSKSHYCREKGVNTSSFCKWHQLLSQKRGNFIRVRPIRVKKPRQLWVKVFGVKLLKLELSRV